MLKIKIRTKNFGIDQEDTDQEDTFQALREFGSRPFRTDDGRFLYALKPELDDSKPEPVFWRDDEIDRKRERLLLNPSICSSWAMWPEESDLPYARGEKKCPVCCDKNKDQCERNDVCLITRSKKTVTRSEKPGWTLKPNIILLSANWSTTAQGGDVFDPARRLAWSDFHSTGRNKKGDDLFRRLLHDTAFQGAYMTDFVKGYINGSLPEVCNLLNDKNDGAVFKRFVEVLKNELADLNDAFDITTNDDIDRCIVVWGPTLMDNLIKGAKKFYGNETLLDLFPGYRWKSFGSHYSSSVRGSKDERFARMKLITDYLPSNDISAYENV